MTSLLFPLVHHHQHQRKSTIFFSTKKPQLCRLPSFSNDLNRPVVQPTFRSDETENVIVLQTLLKRLLDRNQQNVEFGRPQSSRKHKRKVHSTVVVADDEVSLGVSVVSQLLDCLVHLESQQQSAKKLEKTIFNLKQNAVKLENENKYTRNLEPMLIHWFLLFCRQLVLAIHSLSKEVQNRANEERRRELSQSTLDTRRHSVYSEFIYWFFQVSLLSGLVFLRVNRRRCNAWMITTKQWPNWKQNWWLPDDS